VADNLQGFKPISIEDRATLNHFFYLYEPLASELTFTNLFIWRHKYHPIWKIWEDCLLLIACQGEGESFGFAPIGPRDQRKAALECLNRSMVDLDKKPLISRVTKDFVDEFVDSKRYDVVLDRDNSDYVYLTENLIKLPGNRYHRKKNHVGRFKKNYEFQYCRLDSNLVRHFLDLQETWCEIRDCLDDDSLFEEDRAIYEALVNFEALGFQGGAILVGDKVEAFGLGEKLNSNTAVIHVEKANPSITGIYSAISQYFCAEEWSKFKYINREQDLGLEGLRKAKESYYPDHLVDKFNLYVRG
jgi:uncharacterized protein